MIINGLKIKKYRARVKDRSAQTTSPEPVSVDGYKIIEGYISIASVVLNDNDPSKPHFVPVFVSEEIDFMNMQNSGFGRSIFKTVCYREGAFEIIGEVE